MEVNDDIVCLMEKELERYIQWTKEEKIENFPETDFWAIELFIDFLKMEAEKNTNRNQNEK